jgi:hypothetical protein
LALLVASAAAQPSNRLGRVFGKVVGAVMEEIESELHMGVEMPFWGPEGHQLVGAIADKLINAQASAAVQKILGGESLSQAATWADEIKSDPSFAWSKPLHFINTPDWKCDFDSARDCADSVCVYAAINNYTQQLTTASGDDLAMALKFVVHFIGDIHQPLHVGFTNDLGGNSYKGTFLGKQTNLHRIWDTDIIVHRTQEEFGGSQDQYTSYLLGQIQGAWANKAKVWANCTVAACPSVWASESVHYACTNAYVTPAGDAIANGFSLDDSYYTTNFPIIDNQLAAGGVRLATTLNFILGNSKVNTPEQIAANMRDALFEAAKNAGIIAA